MLLLTKYTVLYKENEICFNCSFAPDLTVAPFAGAWIEIVNLFANPFVNPVAPFVGAWIEICLYCRHRRRDQSLPSWEHGCKCRPKSDWHYAESQIVPFFLKIRQFPGFSVKLCTS